MLRIALSPFLLAQCAFAQVGGLEANSSQGLTADANSQGICDSTHQLDCVGEDLSSAGPVLSHIACCNACQAQPGCNAWTWAWKDGGICYLKTGCNNPRRDSDAFHSGIANGPPRPPPAPPAPGPRPTPENPLGITPLPKRSDNFFLIIGDWGKENGPGECQSRVAQMMKDYIARQRAQGKKCLFVGSVGDNFYATGLKDDAHWIEQWANVYGTNDPNSPLFNLPWLSVMGNHDLGNDDPGCACGQGCKQFNSERRPPGTQNFWMPDYNWYYYIEGIDLEIIGLDTNAVDVGNLGGDGCANGARATCQRCGGLGKMASFLNGRKAAGEQLLDQRAKVSRAKTALIMQHYDGPFGAQYKQRFEAANGGNAHVLSAFGHAHDQVCFGSRERGCDVILTGGGAGWQGGAYFGFTAVHLTDDGGFQTVLETSEVRFPQKACRFMLESMKNSSVTKKDKDTVYV